MKRRTLALLAKTAEEAGELTQAAMKTQLHGFDNFDPRTGRKNREALTEEAADVVACIRVLIRAGLIDGKAFSARVQVKERKQNRKFGGKDD